MPGRDSNEAMQGFVDAYGVDFPQAVTEDGSLWAQMGVAFQPAWVFVNDDGTTQVIQGPLAEPDLERILDQLAAA